MSGEFLKAKIQERNAIIGVIGIGYVGLPLTLEFCRAGFNVIGFDVDENKICKLNSRQSYIDYIQSETLQTLYADHFFATSNFSKISEVDAIVIAVPTPLKNHREPDLSHVTKTMETIAPFLRANQLLSFESTTYPGTTDEVIKPFIVKRGLTIGEDFFLVYSPEREDPGRKDFTYREIPKVCGGMTPICLEIGSALYSTIVNEVVPVSSLQAAELTKVFENIHRAVNIGLVNEMKIVADKMGINIHEVIKAASTKPFGFVPYFPGPGIGGHCIPIDPFYLSHKAREFGVPTRFIETAGDVNSTMPKWVVGKIDEALKRNKKKIKSSRILILGIAYKKNVDDLRESPALVIFNELEKMGAKLAFSDPHIEKYQKQSSLILNDKILRGFDCVVVATDHDRFDYDLIINSSSLVVDTRGVYTNSYPNLVRA